MRRVVVLVADGFGVGEAPDAARYGDTGANTLGNLAAKLGGLRLPNLEKLGIGNLGNFQGIAPQASPLGVVSRLRERSEGKDTTTGHWELAGLVTREPFAVFPDGFPKELVDAFLREAGVDGVLGNRAASGTTIIDELGEESLRTGFPIVYTSADSVFQIAASEEAFGLDRLYKVCEAARRVTLPLRIGRVIARPFTGTDRATFRRTEHRRDYAISPGPNCLDILQEAGVEVISVGKIDDIFDHRGITRGNHTGNNRDSFRVTLDFFKSARERAFLFVNLVDFDMLYGHRRDPKGYAGALTALDAWLPELMSEMTGDDCVMLTSDHGCDPTYRGTDHTREFVPLVAYRPRAKGARLPDRATFADVASTVLDAFGIPATKLSDPGTSFLASLRN